MHESCRSSVFLEEETVVANSFPGDSIYHKQLMIHELRCDWCENRVARKRGKATLAIVRARDDRFIAQDGRPHLVPVARRGSLAVPRNREEQAPLQTLESFLEDVYSVACLQ